MYKADFTKFSENVKVVFTTWPQGKPIGGFLWLGLSFIGSKLGGLAGIYFIGLLIILLNTILLFNILEYKYKNRLLSLLIVCSYILFPADTMRFWICETFHLQTSFFFMLLAVNFFFREKKLLGYLVSFLPLLTYETAFFPLIVVPIITFDWKWNKTFLKKLSIHFISITAVLVIYIITRKYFESDSRMDNVLGNENVIDLIKNWISLLIIAPFEPLLAYLVRPFFSFAFGILPIIITVVVTFITYFIVKANYNEKLQGNSENQKILSNAFFKIIITDKQNNSYLYKLIIIGFLSAFICYLPLISHFPPTIWGVSSRIHMAPALGWSLIWGSVLYIFIKKAKQKHKNILFLSVSLYFALLSGFWIGVQKEYVEAWSTQKQITESLFTLNPTVKKNTIIFIRGDIPSPKFRSTLSFTWGQYTSIKQLLIMPEAWDTWEEVPRIFQYPQTSDLRLNDETKLEWHVPAGQWPSQWKQWGDNIIVLDYNNGKMSVPKNYKIQLDNKSFKFENNKDLEGGVQLSDFQKKPLWEIL